jgi:hypothetical protein
MSDLGITVDINAQDLSSPSNGQEGFASGAKSYFGSMEFNFLESERGETFISGGGPLNIPQPRIQYYKMVGYYSVGSVYEVWITLNAPNSTPPSGHSLQNITVSSTWLA